MDHFIVPAEWFVAAILIGFGLSHALHAALWSRLCDDAAKVPYAPLIAGGVALILGALVVIAHNRWALAPTLLITLVGWAWLVKGLVYLLFPGVLAEILRAAGRSPARIRIAGIISVILGLFAAASAAGLFVVEHPAPLS